MRLSIKRALLFLIVLLCMSSAVCRSESIVNDSLSTDEVIAPEGETLINSTDPPEEKTVRITENLVCKTFIADSQPNCTISGYRGIMTRIVNPGAFNRIKAYVCFSQDFFSSSQNTLHAGVLSGTYMKPVGKIDIDSLEFYAKGSSELPETDTFITVDIDLDLIVDKEEDNLYIVIWSSTGNGRWMSRSSINTSVVSATRDYPNIYCERRGWSEECYISDMNYTSKTDQAAAFSLCLVTEGTDDADIGNNQKVITEQDLKDDENPLGTLKSDGGYCAIFNTIACIGDSLTAGVHEHNEATGDIEYSTMDEYSYPTYMQRALGCTVYKNAADGISIKRMLSRLESDDWIGSHKSDCYIIALGTNDMTYTNPLSGSATDVNVSDMTLTNISTDIGAYGKIIQSIRQQVPKSKIFIVSLPNSRNTRIQVEASNVKLRELAELLNCYVIDLEKYSTSYEDKWEYRALYYVGGHLSTLGYKHLATCIMTYIDWIIRHNVDDFAQTAFIQSEREYITINFDIQPHDLKVTQGNITDSLKSLATASNGEEVAYQWYSNAIKSPDNGTEIPGETNANMKINPELQPGEYYYYCVARTITKAVSDVVVVTVEPGDD